MQFVGVSAQPWLGTNTPMVLSKVWSLDQCWPVLDSYEEPFRSLKKIRTIPVPKKWNLMGFSSGSGNQIWLQSSSG
jgi:hypothetical protein